MGYDTRYNGEIVIQPPLRWEEFYDSPFLVRHGQAPERDLKLRMVEEPVNTPDGVMFCRTAVAVVPIYEDPYPGGEIIEHLQELVDAYGTMHSFVGRFDCDGADVGDLWRLLVQDGRAVAIRPTITWPDDADV